ncbi:Dolichyl-phosphate-mannose-protein mannosyltransferase [Colletotrichum higginsianum IMI 349063]|uniref:Dolichyl-phosphate-mannose--protein mannosyltransferase n=3 Tax=Colletotrichum higginsianum TaxID=80884 RepID=A0A1B7Y1K5_COLHI|nr:Dolichyl-phosphate-mannose-protein mannosyltransferase [Colletotrichum higginsianum IMI 349063]OBR05889.1 Dolichyl-phosphate-mannose-protein mannosyltransferase [Colletotrichum higginsianum IMI 349063]TIC90738.1 Dolichyl-phosphate-mannose--protein mannosyltransferase 1 [Colletotrichum higginsianum]
MAATKAVRSQSPKLEKPANGANGVNGKAPVKLESSYKSDGVEDNDIFLLPVSDYQIMLGLTFLAAIVRLFRIYQPTSVVFDEVHFGGFASKYIKGKFFMDVHPPLAKMLIALTGWLAGFNGDFDFKEIGKDYLEPGVPYVAMRMFPAVCGILLAPLMFLTLKATGCRTTTALMGSGLIIFENGLLTQARLILLDSPLMVATAFTALSFQSFTNQHEQGPEKAFQLSWWFWLLMTGLGLGTTVSIKWVGLFTIAWVGSLTLIQLWVLLGDTRNVTPRVWAKHFMARAFALVIIPLGFYMAMFAIHFLCLVNPGDGDGFMSSEFQSTLNSKGMQDVAADVAFGSRVSIRHVNTQGGYLHSHPLMYPTGSKQQQITLYPHKDENNLWLLENQTQPLGINGEQINGTQAWNNLPEPVFIKDGDVVRLYHMPTFRRLHSHDVRPPVTEADWQNEVSAYGYEGFEGDANDLFKIEIVKKKSLSSVSKERLRTIETKFRLVHIMTGCVLFSHKVKLPEWASEQQEVTCARGGTLPNSLWYVEYNEHPQLTGDNVEKVNYRNPGFFGKFWELQKVMWKTNAGLVESHAWDSRPSAWPILKRGINFWGRDNRQIYLLGNPIVWWSSTLAVVVYVLFKGIATLRWQRNCNDYSNTTFKRFDYEIGTAVLGWAFHYFPFYLMDRQLFLHHYFPALYFAVMAFCSTFDFATARISLGGIRNNPIVNRVSAVAFLVLTAVVFVLFSPLAYGNPWTKAECNRVKVLSSWDFDCNTFHDNYSQYTPLLTHKSSVSGATPTPAKSEAPAAPIGGQAGQIPIGDALNEQPKEAAISGVPIQNVLSREEKVEYRDQDGNLLDEEQVKALEGKVEFKTKYETRTRVVDASGNEVQIPEGGWPQEQGGNVAPPHPDVQGVDPETKAKAEDSAVPKVAESVQGQKEAEQKKAKPASDGGKEATAQEEL